MGGITLTRSEFLVLMDAVQAPGVVGLDAGELVPANPGEHKALVAEGIQRLTKRGALRVESGVNVLDTTLIGMAMVLANPVLAVITTRDNPGVGPQLFLHYMAEALAVEQTLPSEDEHRLALVSAAGLVDRLLEILPVEKRNGGEAHQVSLAQDDFFAVKEMAESQAGKKATKILVNHGMTVDGAQQLVAAMTVPEFGGSLAVLQCEKGQVVDGRNLAVVQGAETAWLVKQAKVGSGKLAVTSCDEAGFRSLIADWIGELSG